MSCFPAMVTRNDRDKGTDHQGYDQRRMRAQSTADPAGSPREATARRGPLDGDGTAVLHQGGTMSLPS